MFQDEIDALGYGVPIMTPAANGFSCYEGTPAPRTPPGMSLTRTGAADSDDNSVDFVVAEPTPGSL